MLVLRRMSLLCLVMMFAVIAFSAVTTRPALADAPNYALLDNGAGPSINYTAACSSYSGGVPLVSTFNPLSIICSSSFGWVDHAKRIAFGLLVGMLAIEIFFIAVQQGLFKADLGELVGSVAFKVFVACVLIAVINNADGLFQSISRGFETTGQQLSGTDASTPSVVAGSFALAALGLFAYVGTAHTVDATVPNFPADQPVADGSVLLFTGLAAAGSHLHDVEMQMLFFLSAALLGCAAIILLQFILITAESYIVIFGGIIMLGFAGTKWTLPFAQGYMSYAINNGARLLAFYLVIGIEKSTLGTTFLTTLVAAAAPIAASAFGGAIVAADVAVGVVAIAVLQVCVMTSLVWFIPNLAGSFLGGNSSLTADGMMGKMKSSAASMSGPMKQLASAFQQHKKSSSDDSSSKSSTSSAGGGAPAQGAVPDVNAGSMAPQASTPLQSTGAPSTPGATGPGSAPPVSSNGSAQPSTSLSASAAPLGAIALGAPTPAAAGPASAGAGVSSGPGGPAPSGGDERPVAAGSGVPDGPASDAAPAASARGSVPTLGSGGGEAAPAPGGGSEGGDSDSAADAGGEGSTSKSRIKRPKVGAAQIGEPAAPRKATPIAPGSDAEAMTILNSTSFRTGQMDLSTIPAQTRQQMASILRSASQSEGEKAERAMDGAGASLASVIPNISAPQQGVGSRYQFSDPSENVGR